MDVPFGKGIHGERVIHALPALRNALGRNGPPGAQKPRFCPKGRAPHGMMHPVRFMPAHPADRAAEPCYRRPRPRTGGAYGHHCTTEMLTALAGAAAWPLAARAQQTTLDAITR